MKEFMQRLAELIYDYLYGDGAEENSMSVFWGSYEDKDL